MYGVRPDGEGLTTVWHACTSASLASVLFSAREPSEIYKRTVGRRCHACAEPMSVVPWLYSMVGAYPSRPTPRTPPRVRLLYDDKLASVSPRSLSFARFSLHLLEVLALYTRPSRPSYF